MSGYHIGHAQPVTMPTTPEAVQQADALIDSAFASVDADGHAHAAEVYLALLAQLDRLLEPTEAEVVHRHLRQLTIVMPTAMQAQLGLDVWGEGHALPESEGIGARLVQWWRQQDGLPGTENNERLEEHLRRVAHATNEYAHADDLRGFDDRGEIYVRLGIPTLRTSIENRSPELRMKPAHARIPKNEFWVYDHIAHDAYYLFVQRSGRRPYHVTETAELLRHRDLDYMEEVLSQLAMKHTAFGNAYDAITKYQTTSPRATASPSTRIAAQILADVRMQDSQHEYARSVEVPVAHSNTLGFRATLDVPMRWARFLDPDGTTRTEVYWNLDLEALQPSKRLVRLLERQGQTPSERYLIGVALAQHAADHQLRQVQRKHYLTSATQTQQPVVTSVARGDTGRYHVALQWDQQWVVEDEGRLEPGVQLGVGVQRIDTLQALHGAGQRLEMSDLKPVRYQPDQLLESADPYPHAQWHAEDELALYFEVYHLAFTANDETSYTIAYEVSRPGRKRLLAGRGADQLTTTAVSYQGQQRTAQEYVAVDIADWNGQGELNITIRVTDEVTGEQVSRDITFSNAD
ncbi:MAG: hypothetical protein RhofKO_05390 [Rhodothermales bacterium]